MVSIQKGRLIKMIRTEKGLTLKDLADDNISVSTLSKIERWDGYITEDKIYYYLAKLGITWGQLEDRLRRVAKEERDHRFNLSVYEFIIDNGNADYLIPYTALMGIDGDHPFRANYEYIKGRVQLKRKQPNLVKARRHFEQAIKLSNQYPDYSHLNIIAAAYNSLGMIAYLENDLAESLFMYESGIECFYENGERMHYKYILLSNQALILIKQAKYDEASAVNMMLFDCIDRIKRSQAKASIYLNQSYIYHHKQMYCKAVKMAQKGIEIAKENDLKKVGFYLWIALGKTYEAVGNYDRARTSLLAAWSICSQLPKSKLLDIRILTLQAKVNLRTGHIKAAQDDITESIQLCKQANDTLKLVKSLMIQSEIYVYKKMPNEARISLTEAKYIAIEHDFDNELKEINRRFDLCICV